VKISTILDHIDNGHMALPEFQRGYVWNRDQVRGLFQSAYRRYPIGSLLVWATESERAEYRGDAQIAPGVIKLLLDGQQRMTSLYGLVRGKPPKFFDGNEQAFTGLMFNVDTEEFSFYQPVKMKGDPMWIDVSELMKQGLDKYITQFSQLEGLNQTIGTYVKRLNNLHSIRDIDLHIEEVTGEDKSIDVVVDIFNRVNSGGTKLSQGDLALAKICADSPLAREQMKAALKRWHDAEYHFNLDWLLRNINTVLTGEAKFVALHNLAPDQFQDGLNRAEKSIDSVLNLIAGRLGLDHDRVFFSRYAVPVMTHYMDRRGGRIDDDAERDKLLYWYLAGAMWGRYSTSTESTLNRDLGVIEDLDGALDRLINELKMWKGDLRVFPAHFSGWSIGARFYPVLYLLTRIGEANDWGNGLPLKKQMLGKMSNLEVHHIFPKALLYRQNYRRPEVNAVANFCFLTKDTNLHISDSPPEVYFHDIASKHPGALESQWIPMDERLWKAENYRDFLEARRELLAEAANHFLVSLYPDHLEAPAATTEGPVTTAADAQRAAFGADVLGGVDSEQEEQLLLEVNQWVIQQGLPEGAYLHELTDVESGTPLAIFDLAWPQGLQEELSEPVALLIDEGPEVLAIANAHGFRYFTNVEMFKGYVRTVILAEQEVA
jgi:hypothetical protein